MTRQLSHRHVAILIGLAVCLGAMSATAAFAQDPLARAKTFYASASYEEALAALTDVNGKPVVTESTEAGLYEVLCLVALGRNDAAKQVIERIVRAAPEYRLTDEEASPRVRTMYDAVRKPMLMGIVRESYTKGRDAFDRKDLPVAVKEFDRAIALIAELDPASDQGLRDIKTLASGFRDLASAAPTPKAAEPEVKPAAQPPVTTAAAAPPPAAARPPAPAPPVAPSIFGPDDASVKPPVAISQALPPWRPQSVVEKMQEFRGTIDLVIDEQGRVVSAAVGRSVHATYDGQLLEAARKWAYRPATMGGKPVRYRHTVAVNLRPTS
jgi:TonB family protein